MSSLFAFGIGESQFQYAGRCFCVDEKCHIHYCSHSGLEVAGYVGRTNGSGADLRCHSRPGGAEARLTPTCSSTSTKHTKRSYTRSTSIKQHVPVYSKPL